MSYCEEKGGEYAGEPKYCEVCDDVAHKYLSYMGQGGYVCYDCYMTFLENAPIGRTEESKS